MRVRGMVVLAGAGVFEGLYPALAELTVLEYINEREKLWP